MYPGITTRLTRSVVASAATIIAATDVIILTGTTAIDTITPKSMNKSGQDQLAFFIPTDGTVATTTNGNVVAAQTMLQNRVTTMVWDAILGKWYPHALS